jgi:exonuclease III
MRIACFNVEKNGASSTMDKQTQVDGFIERCCEEKGWDCDVIFLCEIHNKQASNYVEAIQSRYHAYRVEYFPGAGSNYYVVIVKAFAKLVVCSQGDMKGVHRELINVQASGVNGFTGDIMLAHFKSGGSGLTKSQLTSSSSTSLCRWVVAGDMNWDFGRLAELNPPGLGYDCWNGKPTHKSGSRLDWVLADPNTTVKPVDITGMEDTFNMGGPDHRPILFDVT